MVPSSSPPDDGIRSRPGLRIGLDGTTLLEGRSGIGFYTEHLFTALLSVSQAGRDLRPSDPPPADAFVLFSNRRIHSDRLPAGLAYQGGAFPIRGIWLQVVLPFLLRRLQVDLCHYTNYVAPLWSRCPSVVTFHDMTLSLLPQLSPWKKRLLLRPLIPLIARRADAIIAVSESARRDILRLLPAPSEKIHVIPEGVSPVFRPVSDPGHITEVMRKYGLTRPYFVTVGTVEPRKNIVRLARAFAVARAATGRRLQLLIVGGEGWGSRGIRRKAAEMVGPDAVWAGYAPTEDLPVLFGGAIAMVYPSLYEGFGLPVVEGMASGVPVIVSDHPALREVAGDAALFVDPLDDRSIAGAMQRVLLDASLRDGLRDRGLSRAAKFTWEEAARRTLSVYQDVLRNRATGTGTVKGWAQGRGPLWQGGTQVETPAGTRQREPELGGRGRLGEAVQRTVVYAGLFDYPLTPDEMHRGLFGLPAERKTVERAAERSGLVTRVAREGRVFLPIAGREETVDLRLSREGAHRVFLDRMRGALTRLSAIPFVRMVALSGGSALSYGDDLDLFVIAGTRRVWTVSLLTVLLARVTGVRRRVCINYLVDEEAMNIPARDFFTAHQILTLKPIYGLDVYWRFVRENRWVLSHFPNFTPMGEEEPFRIEVGRWKGEAERCLGRGWDGAEEAVRAAYGTYLRRRIGSEWPRSGVSLTPRRLQLNVVDHRESITDRLDRAMEQVGKGREGGKNMGE